MPSPMAGEASREGTPHMRMILIADEAGELHQVKGYSLSETAELMGLHPDTVRRRTKSGQWPHVYVGRNLYFTEEQVARIVQAQTHEYPAR